MTTTMTKERPILFRGDMVQAILDGKKTQTRRIAKFEAREEGLNFGFSGLEAGAYANDLERTGWVLRSRDGRGTWNDRTYPLHCPYGLTGDALWVRETAWYDREVMKDIGQRCFYADGHVTLQQKANYGWSVGGEIQAKAGHLEELYALNHSLVKKPSIFMPRWASRITLEVTKVRVERLNQISDADVEAEGFASLAKIKAPEAWNFTDRFRQFNRLEDGANPWLWVIEFRVSDNRREAK